MLDASISFTAKIWLYSGAKTSWHFVTLPADAAEQVRFFVGNRKTKGWGAVPVKVSIGNTTWQTSIFPDKKLNSFILPLKAEVRKKEKLELDQKIQVLLEIKL